jgi:hypothetical protein
MVKGSEIKVCTAALGTVALLVLGSAVAAPPQSRVIQPRSQTQAQIQTLGQRPALSATLNQHLDLQHLDLRAPSLVLDAAQKPDSFPSMSRRQNAASAEQLRLPALGSDGMRSRPSVQEFVQRVHREGLPVARLFENKSALVHLGLSPKGKPGLWLVQKIH